jgi:hypothetical protein
MKRLLLIISLFISVTSFAAPWDIIKTLPNVLHVHGFVWHAAYTPSGQDELAVTVYLDEPTGNYDSRVTVSVYGNYRKTQLGWPQVYWEWGYKEFTIDLPPNSSDGMQNYTLHAGESFNMSGVGTANGQGEGLASGQVTLVSFVQL